jgi:general secretion pathway protein J
MMPWRAFQDLSVSKPRQQGFTLVEVLLALAITAIIAVISYQALSSAAEGAQKTREVLTDINQLDRAWQIIAADMRHVLPPEVGPRGERFSFVGSSLRSTGENAEQVVLFFARNGWVNPLQRLRSDMQIVSYRVSEGQLWREYLPERNLSSDDIEFETASLKQALITGVDDIQLRFLSQQILQDRGRSALDGYRYTDSWVPEWPAPGQTGTPSLPLAVEVTIDIKGVGASVRLFELSQ